jgi:hypothetical protein
MTPGRDQKAYSSAAESKKGRRLACRWPARPMASGVEPAETSKAKTRRRFVRRGKTWLRAARIACRAGESVFVRDAPGKFSKIGVVAADGTLPVAYLMKGDNE